MIEVIAEVEADQRAHRLFGRKFSDGELPLFLSLRGVDGLERREPQRVLVAHVRVEHPLVGLRLARDHVDARSGESACRELAQCGRENTRLGAGGGPSVRSATGRRPGGLAGFRLSRHALSCGQLALSGNPMLK
jgi:hypothetical protein